MAICHEPDFLFFFLLKEVQSARPSTCDPDPSAIAACSWALIFALKPHTWHCDSHLPPACLGSTSRGLHQRRFCTPIPACGAPPTCRDYPSPACHSHFPYPSGKISCLVLRQLVNKQRSCCFLWSRILIENKKQTTQPRAGSKIDFSSAPSMLSEILRYRLFAALPTLWVVGAPAVWGGCTC